MNDELTRDSWYKRSDAYIAAFAMPVAVLIVLFIQRGIFPFGVKSYLRTDMYHQYAPFLAEFRHKIVSGESLLYSWDIGMGVNFTALYAYYLASPFNWLVALVPKEYVIEFMTYMIVFKSGLASVTMTWYLGRKSERTVFISAVFGILYALSGYMIAYTWNVMWIDCIILFPLIMAGIESLVFEHKYLLYTVSLGLCIITNYYISIPICMFLVIYFIILNIARPAGPGEFFKRAGIFALCSLLAGALAAFLLIPETMALMKSTSADSTFPKAVKTYFSLLETVSRHFICVESENGLDHWPNIYCGCAAIPLFFLWLKNREISFREKCLYCVMLVILLLSFNVDVLNYIWHGLHYPNSLPARHSFIYIFLVLTLCFRTVDRLDGNDTGQLGTSFIIGLGFVFLCEYFVKDDAFTMWSFYVTALFMALFGLLIYLYMKGKAGVNAAACIALVLIAVEMEVNAAVTGVPVIDRPDYVNDNAAARELTAAAYEKDDTFFRIEKITGRAKDDGAWLNFHSAPLFSSTAQKSMSDFFRQVGCESYVNSYCLNGATPLVDSLFGIKYGIYNSASDDPTLTEIAVSDTSVLYENPYVLPIGYAVDDSVRFEWQHDSGNGVDVQNDLTRLLGCGDILRPVDGFTDGSIYSVTAPEDGAYYAVCTRSGVDTVNAKAGKRSKKFDKVSRKFLLEIGRVDKGEIIDLSCEEDVDPSFTVYVFDYDVLRQVYEKLSHGGLNVTSYTSDSISGTVHSEDEGFLVLTVPYDEGWTAEVDGYPVDIDMAFGALSGIPVAEGDHTVRLKYRTPGLDIGLMISAGAGIIVLILLIVGGVKLIRAKKEKEMYEGSAAEPEEVPEEQSEELFGEPTEDRNGRDEHVSGAQDGAAAGIPGYTDAEHYADGPDTEPDAEAADAERDAADQYIPAATEQRTGAGYRDGGL